MIVKIQDVERLLILASKPKKIALGHEVSGERTRDLGSKVSGERTTIRMIVYRLSILLGWAS